MQKVIGLFVCLMALLACASFSLMEKEKVQWLTIAEMQAAYKKAPKPILIDVYTSWCSWCKVMDKQTYKNDKVAAYINDKYYAVRFDAESRDSIELNGKKYGYNEQNKINDMAIFLLSGQLSFPTTVFLISPGSSPAPLAGYLKPNEIESPLKFFGEGAYKTKNFQEYSRSFKPGW